MESFKGMASPSVPLMSRPTGGVFETLFTAFHHFKPDDAKRILADAAAKRRTIVVIEPFERANLPLMTVAGFVRGIIATPFVGQMTPARFLWTYPIPISAAVLAWDGAVSCLRAYQPNEMLCLRIRPYRSAIVGMLAENRFPAPCQAQHHVPDWRAAAVLGVLIRLILCNIAFDS